MWPIAYTINESVHGYSFSANETMHISYQWACQKKPKMTLLEPWEFMSKFEVINVLILDYGHLSYQDPLCGEQTKSI